MKYLKNFSELLEGNTVTKYDSSIIKTVLMNIFKIFKTKDDLSEIFDDEHEMTIMTDLYDSLIDTRELLELSSDDLQSFADNLGEGGEDDILVAIVKKMYSDKYKREIKTDIDFCIKTLKDFIEHSKGKEKYIILSERYLIELEKIKNIL